MIDSNHLTRQGRFQAWQFCHDLVKYGPAYFRQFENDLGEPESVKKIPVVKTHQVPAYAMDIAQSTAKGNAIENLLGQGGVGNPASNPGARDMMNHIILFHGDLSTFEWIESILESRSIEKTPFCHFQYIIFVPGLFHVKMACVDALWRTFVEPKDAHKDPTSMMEHASIL